MATPNYGYEKRQKELAKKRKKEEKLKAKADRKAGLVPDEDTPSSLEGEQADEQSPVGGTEGQSGA